MKQSQAETSPTEDRAEKLESALLRRAGFDHGFFTRRGGVSLPPWDTLSFATSVGDEPRAVGENLSRAARALGVAVEKLYVFTQVHGTDAKVLSGVEDREQFAQSRGDILLSRAAGTACGVRIADCVPVLLGDRATGAVAAIHSGWRGTADGAVAAGVKALRVLINGQGDLVAAIGPHIACCCFEVGEDVAAALAACSPEGNRAVVFGAGERRRVDLRLIVHAQLKAAGLPEEAIDDVAGCTVCEPDRFHSHRRDGSRSGRLLSAIVAR